MKQILKCAISVALSVCVLLCTFTAVLTAGAYTYADSARLVISADNGTDSITRVDHNGTFYVRVGVADYADCIDANNPLAAAVVNISYDESLVTPDIDSLSTYSGIASKASVNAKNGVLTFVFTGDNTSYISRSDLDNNNGKLFAVAFNAKNADGDASFGIFGGEDTSVTSLAALDLSVADGTSGKLINDITVNGIGDSVTVRIGAGDSFVYSPKHITVSLADATGKKGYWYAPDNTGYTYVGDYVSFNTAYAKITLGDTENYEPWTAYFTVAGGSGSGNSAGNFQLYMGNNGGSITLDKPGTWNLYCYNNDVKYTLMSLVVYPTPKNSDILAAKAFDALVDELPVADTITVADEDVVMNAYNAYESLSAAATTFVTKYDKYIAVYRAYLADKFGSYGRAMAIDAINAIEALPEPGDVILDDADRISKARLIYDNLDDEYKEFVDNYKKLRADESAFDAIYVSKTVGFTPSKDLSATSTNYVNMTDDIIYVSDKLKNNAWWKDYTFNYEVDGVVYSGIIYSAIITCPSANISQNAQVGYGNTTGASGNAYTLTAAGEWYIYGTIKDSVNGDKYVLLKQFTVLPTPTGNADTAAAADVVERINALPEILTSAHIDLVHQLKDDYDALVRYDLVPDAQSEKLAAAVNRIKFIENLVCDINDDGTVDSSDLLIMQQMLLGQIQVKSVADIDGNGVVDAVDLLRLEQHVLGISKLF